MVRKIITNKFFILVLLIFLFVIISSLEGNTFFKKEESKTLEQNNISKESKKERITEGKEEPIEENTIIESPTPTETTIQGNSKNSTIDFLIYPNSTLITKTDSAITLESNNSTDEITDWYKSKIEEYDMNVTSTVKTNTNGNVLNKISASNGSLKIEVEISASNSSNLVKIVAKLL